MTQEIVNYIIILVIFLIVLIIIKLIKQKSKTMSCDKCGHVFAKEKSTCIKVTDNEYTPCGITEINQYKFNLYFCPKCKPNYDEIIIGADYKRKYYKTERFEVSEDGKRLN